MRHISPVWAWVVLAVMGWAGAAAWAAEDDAAAAFERLREQYRQKVAGLQELRSEFAGADAERREQIRQRFDAEMDEARQLLEQTTEAAVRAYRADPNDAEEPARHLMQVVERQLADDAYEAALERAEVLIEHDDAEGRVYDMAGVAAFVMNDYDKAERYFRMAEGAGRLSRMGQQYASLVDEYRGYWARERRLRRAEAEADDLPRVKLHTSAGDLVVELFENEAPNTVANFVHLVERGFYDGTIFHRVLANFMAQGGDPTGTGSGGPGWAIACECYREGFRRHFRGSLSMAHAGRDTGGSQFFLTFVPTAHLNGKHTVFGRVVEGMEVLAKLRRRDPQRGGAADRIIEATVLRKRDHEYAPEKLPARR